MRFRNEKTGKIITISERATTQRDVLKTLMEQGELPTNNICTITEHPNCYNASHSLEGKNILRSEKYRAGIGLKDPITGNFLTRATHKSISTARKGAIAEITNKVDKISTIYDTKGLSKRSTEVKLKKLVGHDELPATPRDWNSGSKIKEVLSPNLIDYSTKNWWRDKKFTDSLGLMEHYVTDQKIIPTSQRTPWLKNTVKQVTGFVPMPYSMCSWDYNSELKFEGFIDPSLYYKPLDEITDNEIDELLKVKENDLINQIGLMEKYRKITGTEPPPINVDYSSFIVPEQLFSLDKGYKKYFVGGPVNANLAQAFQSSNVTLSKSATISEKNKRTWVVEDRGLVYKVKYAGPIKNPYNVKHVKKDTWKKIKKRGLEIMKLGLNKIHYLLCDPNSNYRLELLIALDMGALAFLNKIIPLFIGDVILQGIALLITFAVWKLVTKYGVETICDKITEKINTIQRMLEQLNLVIN